ncbi:MAG: hypothetical protein GC179_12585 [Anaerolineaceae bacterium]|nr:hypothetical protein [Anaerolineaceae bacterium]
MPEQTPRKKEAVVGEDGELLQPDVTVDLEKYGKYVATYVHRDPLLFRLREHVKDWGCVYLFFAPWIVLLTFGVLLDILSNGPKVITSFLLSLALAAAIIILTWMGVIYIISKVERLFRSG